MLHSSPELFDFIGKPAVHKLSTRMIGRWLIRHKDCFCFYFICSAFSHLVLFGLIAGVYLTRGNIRVSSFSQSYEFEIFRKSLKEAVGAAPSAERLATALSEIKDSALYEAYTKAPQLDKRINDREKTAIYKAIISKALDDFKQRTGSRSTLEAELGQYFDRLCRLCEPDAGADFGLIQIKPALSENSIFFKLTQDKARKLQSLTVRGKLRNDSNPEVIQSNQGGVLTAPRDYFYRDSPYRQILAMGAMLFYIVKGFPEIVPSRKDPQSSSSKADSSPLTQPGAVNRQGSRLMFNVIYLANYHVRDSSLSPTTSLPLLDLPADKSAQILDDLMTYSDDEQVRIFNKQYLQRYNSDSLDLARLTKDFIYRNLGMVFVLTDPLSRGFDFLEEIYFDNISQDEMVDFWLENPRSRTGAEILFNLAGSYEFERRAIIALDESLDVAKRVLDDPSADRFYVYNIKAKAYVLRAVYRDLHAELRRLGYPSRNSVLRKYKDEQIRIYNLLIEMGGDIKSRAQYALGRLYWDEGDTKAAMMIWKDIVPSFYSCLSGTRPIMDQCADSPKLISLIQEILDKESTANRHDLFERLERFHKWETRSAGRD